MLLLQLSFVLVGLAGIFPYSMEFAGFNPAEDIQDTVNSMQVMYERLAGEGILSSAALTAYVLIMGVKIVLEFLLMTLVGAYPLLTAIGLPAAFAVPISMVLGAVCVYGAAVKFLGR
ncbi:hypothetical protein MSHOH_2639 [Methanosarcina horonobensis HB-1 = JCM 15518]|uniref:Uncharacterized protein n=1 Tax=Methanosarcina horonobensis HB-1 = JCM 15518 TaxID=1434110 RepID=A0A0E3SFS6_9EURY|nr:hypothetical protein [Methanosarcina horonobensis]AKB79122.1 hypothetical protein MSHOH_2639 [Methanosarcina horonobensis HB-1 = JCM 15518]